MARLRPTVSLREPWGILVGCLAVVGCLPFGEYVEVVEGGATGVAGAEQGGAGGEHVGGEGGGKVCNPIEPENPNCADCERNGMETDVDCGGDACGPCPLSAVCAVDADCESGNCDALACVPAPLEPQCLLDPDNPSCADCVLNGAETATDCGGDACGPCDEGDGCNVDADCKSGNCAGATCGPSNAGCEPEDLENPSCGDCTQNGSETDEDCGGDACEPCQTDEGCLIDGDCLTLNCDGGSCGDPVAPECPTVDPGNPTCADCEMNGLESDVDCGGDSCGPCSIGDGCNSDADCASENCSGGSCS